MKKFLIVLVIFIFIFACKKDKENITKGDTKKITTPEANQSELKFIGHMSFKIKDSKGTVVYVDPFYGSEEDYKEAADYIFVTHSHPDHNKIELVTKKDTTKVISAKESVPDTTPNVEFVAPYISEVLTDTISVDTFPAFNEKHPRENDFLGFILTIDGKKIYISGDTSFFDEMSALTEKKIDYAFLSTDGIYNMGPEEATRVAELIKAKYSIPVHTGFNDQNEPIFNEENVILFTPENKMVLKYGDGLKF